MPRLLITGAEDPEGLGAHICDLAPKYFEIYKISGDVIRMGKSAIDAEVEAIVSQVDITHVINNFGINHLSLIGQTPEDDEDILRCNVLGPYWMVNALRALDQWDVKCLNIASQTYRIPQTATSLYCASKAALVHMTKVMARELSTYGWQVNALAPGKIAGTAMTILTDEQVLTLRDWKAEYADEYSLRNIPMGRFATRYEMAKIAWHVLGLPRYITGEVIGATGGQ